MLKDQDRIFQNLYGMGERSLKAAQSRGCWDGTADIIGRGRDKIIEEMKASGLRGRRRGLSDRLKWSMPKEPMGALLSCGNADESEPATCRMRDHARSAR